MTPNERQAKRGAQARAWLNDNKTGDVCSWTEIFMEMGIPSSTYNILVSELTKLMASIEAATLEEVMREINRRVNGMNDDAIDDDCECSPSALSSWLLAQIKER